jgi:glycerophosphoryl diester phosphodiesterase
MMRFSPQLRDLSWVVARPIAHRGLHDKKNGILENTQSAFAAAMAGNYAIECDLQLTADGEAVVFHDHVVDRLCDGTGMVHHLSTKAMKALPYRVGSDRVQTLAELLEQVDGNVPLIIEIKSLWNDDPTLTLRALTVLEPYAGPYCLMSFDPDVVQCLAEASPITVRGIVADRTHDADYAGLPVRRRVEMRRFDHLHRTRPHFVSFSFKELPWAPVQRIRAAGHPVISWTIRSAEQAALAQRHSDQITFEGFAP